MNAFPHPHPSLFFVKFLISQRTQDSKNDGWIIYTLKTLSYPEPHPDFVKAVRKEFEAKVPKNFQPTDVYNRESVKFLRSEGIYSIYNPDDATRQAASLVTNLRVRAVLDQLLLGRLEPKDAALRINSRFREFFTVPVIEAYSHYYWNVKLLKVEDWVELLGSESGRTMSKYLSILEVGPAMALYSAGFSQNIETRTMLQELGESLYFDFREWKTMPLSKGRTMALTTLARAACQIHEQMTQADAAIKESLKQFEKFRMQHNNIPVLGVDEVAPIGNYSLSGTKLLDAAPIPRDEDEK